MRVLVLGGAGFIGRHAVAAVVARGHEAIVGSRHPGRSARRVGLPGVAWREAHLERIVDAADADRLLDGVDAVLNCVGILRERGRESYHAVHVRAPLALAAACRARGLGYTHVSALGLAHPHRSRFLRSKQACEAQLAASGADWRLVRPSLLDGPGGFGARWIRAVARLPVQPVPAGAGGCIAVLRVDELGEALARVVEQTLAPDAGTAARSFDLGGPHALTIAQYLAAWHRVGAARAPLQVPLPRWLARLASHACDLLHATPLSFGHFELLQVDNLPTHNRLAELLGRAPRDVFGDALGSPLPTPDPAHSPSLPTCAGSVPVG
jgi:NADH dehydrogenase